MSYTNPTPREVEIRRSELARFDHLNERVSLALFSCILMQEKGQWPKRYLDLGSGTGAMVNMARKIGIESYGVDVINGPEDYFIHADLNEELIVVKDPRTGLVMSLEPMSMDTGVHFQIMQFDLITCIEVAEHINPISSEILVDNIARHLKKEGLLVFSSAPPGQKGEHHINAQPAEYWRSLFYDVGISYREDLTRQLSHIWSWVSGPLMWLGSNVSVYDS